MGAEGDDGLAGKIVFLQKGIQGLGHIAPPVGIAQKDGGVPVGVFNMGGQLRAGAGILFFGRLVHQRLMVQRVLLHRFDLEQVAAHRLLDDPGHILHVAQHLAVADHDAGPGHGIRSVCIHILRHGEIRDQDAGAVCRLRGIRLGLPLYKGNILRCLCSIRICRGALRLRIAGCQAAQQQCKGNQQ